MSFKGNNSNKYNQKGFESKLKIEVGYSLKVKRNKNGNKILPYRNKS